MWTSSLVAAGIVALGLGQAAAQAPCLKPASPVPNGHQWIFVAVESSKKDQPVEQPRAKCVPPGNKPKRGACVALAIPLGATSVRVECDGLDASPVKRDLDESWKVHSEPSHPFRCVLPPAFRSVVVRGPDQRILKLGKVAPGQRDAYLTWAAKEAERLSSEGDAAFDEVADSLEIPKGELARALVKLHGGANCATSCITYGMPSAPDPTYSWVKAHERDVLVEDIMARWHQGQLRVPQEDLDRFLTLVAADKSVLNVLVLDQPVDVRKVEETLLKNKFSASSAKQLAKELEVQTKGSGVAHLPLNPRKGLK